MVVADEDKGCAGGDHAPDSVRYAAEEQGCEDVFFDQVLKRPKNFLNGEWWRRVWRGRAAMVTFLLRRVKVADESSVEAMELG